MDVHRLILSLWRCCRRFHSCINLYESCLPSVFPLDHSLQGFKHDRSVGNPGLLRSHVLDLVGCMHISLGISRSNTMENNDFKTILE